MSRKPEHLLPLIRHLSVYVTPLLVRTPLSANHVTTLSLAVGLAASWFIGMGDRPSMLAGAWLFVLCYIIDNCDGEVARLKNQSSDFGDKLDTFVDWAVHTAFFAALGLGVARQTGGDIWLWLGGIAAGGGTVNYLIGLVVAARDRKEKENQPPASGDGEDPPPKPQTWDEWAIFALRELSRADFCFIVLVLAAFDLTWVLLPAGAVGAQVYWLTRFFRGARDY